MLPIKKQILPALAEIYRQIQNEDPEILDSNIFDNELDKRADALLAYSLAEEQGFICCYCMNRIEMRFMKDSDEPIRGRKTREGVDVDASDKAALPLFKCKVEHFKPRSIYDGIVKKPDLRIKYENLLCACEGHIGKDLYCDTLKDDTELIHLPNPANTKTKDFQRLYQLRYTENGRVKSDHAGVNEEIGGEEDISKANTNIVSYKTGVLNLNCQTLINLRHITWRTLTAKITKEAGTEKWDENIKKVLPIAQKYHDLYSKKDEDRKYFPFCASIVYLLEKRFKQLRKP